jgi:hypothetical protein
MGTEQVSVKKNNLSRLPHHTAHIAPTGLKVAHNVTFIDISVATNPLLQLDDTQVELNSDELLPVSFLAFGTVLGIRLKQLCCSQYLVNPNGWGKPSPPPQYIHFLGS